MRRSSVGYPAASALAHAATWLSRGPHRGRRIMLVSGTNGTSTTTAMIAAALRATGPVATNADGADTPTGLAWTIATSACDDVVLQVDESWMPWAVGTLRPDAVVLLNLGRDRRHRRPVWPVAEAWRAAMREVPRVVASADDPAVVWATLDAAEVVYVGTGSEWAPDSVLCPGCRTPLHDRAGGWWCRCGLARPAFAVGVAHGRVVVEGMPLGRGVAFPGSACLGSAAMAVAAVHGRVVAKAALDAIAAGSGRPWAA